MNNYMVKSNGMWTGQVEDTNDPLKIGRCKVRIFGVHSMDVNIVPTASLPWAMPLNSVNSSKSFSSLVEGDFVMGVFQDGFGGQVPVMLGVTPGIPSATYVTKNKDPVKTDPAPYQTLTSTEPNSSNTSYPPNTPTSSVCARGDYAGGMPSKAANKNISHNCDFKFQINLGLDSLGLIDPVGAILAAIKSGKNQSAQYAKLILTSMATELRKVIDTILAALSFDPTGELSVSYSVAKDIFRKINELTMQAAMYAEIASFYVGLVENIKTIVAYLESLPARIRAMVQECIFQFTNSVTNFANQVKAIPGVLTNNVNSAVNTLTAATSSAVSLLSTPSTSATPLPESLNTLVNQPSGDHADSITTYIAGLGNSAATLLSAQESSFNKSNLQSP